MRESHDWRQIVPNLDDFCSNRFLFSKAKKSAIFTMNLPLWIGYNQLLLQSLWNWQGSALDSSTGGFQQQCLSAQLWLCFTATIASASHCEPIANWLHHLFIVQKQNHWSQNGRKFFFPPDFLSLFLDSTHSIHLVHTKRAQNPFHNSKNLKDDILWACQKTSVPPWQHKGGWEGSHLQHVQDFHSFSSRLRATPDPISHVLTKECATK